MKTDIKVSYGLPGEYAALAEHGRKMMILEVVAEWLSQHFTWRNPISLEMEQCGDPGARWEFRSKRIVVCYELVREFVQLHRDYGQKSLVADPMVLSKNKQVIPAKRINKKRTKAFRLGR